MRYHLIIVHLLMTGLLLAEWGVPHAQTPSAAPVESSADLSSSPATRESVAARKAEVSEQLKALVDSKPSGAALKAARAPLDRLLEVLTGLEGAWRHRESYTARLEALPQRVRDAEAAYQQLETRPPQRIPAVSESERDEAQSQLKVLQEQLQELNKDIAAGAARFGAIAKEFDARSQAQTEAESALRKARAQSRGDTPSETTETMQWRLMLLRAETEGLRAERDWLTKRGPLDDALVRLTRLRVQTLQRELDTMQATVESAIRQKQDALSDRAADLKRQLTDLTAPAKRLPLEVQFETVAVRQATANYRQMQSQLTLDLRAQQSQTSRLQQRIDRLMSMAQRYQGGDYVGQRFLDAFSLLRRQRLQYPYARLVKTPRQRLDVLSSDLFTLEEQLLDFNDYAQMRLDEFSATLPLMPDRQRDANVAQLSQAIDAQRVALRDQQQVLAPLVQFHSELLDAYREHRRRLNSTYTVLVKQMFWIRDARPLGWETLPEAWVGIPVTFARLYGLGQALRAEIRDRFGGRVRFGLLAGAGLILLVLVAWAYRRLGAQLRRDLETASAQQTLPGVASNLLLLAQATLWPAYLALLAWGLTTVLPFDVSHRSLGLAMVRGVWIGAAMLAAVLLASIVLKPQGWAERGWNAPEALCRFLRRPLLVGGVATLVLMVPYVILRSAPGSGLGAAETLLLVRVAFLGFQVVILLLVALAAAPHSPLMETVLARSREHQGLLQRLWPFAYALLLIGMLLSMVLNVLGYDYAARSLWFDTLQSMAVIVGVRLLMLILVVRMANSMVLGVIRRGDRLTRRHGGFEATLERAMGVYQSLIATFLWLVAAVVILEIWGFSFLQFLDTPDGVVVTKRLLLVALALGVTVAVIKFINTMTAFLLTPRPTRQGVMREPSAKLKTMAPLIQTLVKIGLMFGALLLILEIVGLNTTPFLTGLGIFGLAIGFASQSLIKDVINGLFILFEDSVSVGDIANLNGKGGQVEKITLRAITLRGLDGTVSVIPNSTIDVVNNMTKGFSRYVLDIRVKLDEDVERVMEIMRQIDEEMRQDPAFGPDMILPLELLGVDRFEDSGLIVRARLNTKPIRQWAVGREYNRRLQLAFKEQGVQIPVPHRMLFWDTPPNGQRDPMHQTPEHNSAPPHGGSGM